MPTPSNGASVWSLEFGFGEVHENLPNGSFVVWFMDKDNRTVHIETYDAAWKRIVSGAKTNKTLFTAPQDIMPIPYNSYV